MAIGDITVGLLELLWRFVVDLIVDVVFEVLVKRVGYFIAAHVFRMRMPDPDGIPVICIGLGLWAAIGFALFSLLA